MSWFSLNCGPAVAVPPTRLLKLIDELHLLIEVLRQEPLQAGQLHRVAQRDHVAHLGVAVDAGEEADRALDFGHQVAEHRPHRLEHGLGVLGRRGVALQVLGLGERELQLLGQRLGEVVAADRECCAARRGSRW